MYSKYAGTELDVAGEPHLILKVDDIIGSLAGDDVSKLKPFGAPLSRASRAPPPLQQRLCRMLFAAACRITSRAASAHPPPFLPTLRASAGDRLLIEKTAAATKTSGGILLPEAAKEAPVTGKVVAVGPGRTEEDGTVKARRRPRADTPPRHTPPTVRHVCAAVKEEKFT